MATVKGEVIMDYEKKYKEMKARVLEIGRGYVKGLDYSKPRQIAEYIDPELKEESADERIINRIKKAVENYWSDEPLNEILAWLEKKELKKIEQKSTIFIPKFRVGDVVKSKSQPMLDARKIISIGKDYYLCEDRGCIGFAWEDDCELVEPKQEWSEEDDNCLSTIIAEFSKCSGKSVSKDEWMRCNDFLNSLKDRVQPQSKQEWGDEDETYSDHVITAIKSYYTDDLGEENPWREKLLRWLKSLRPQSTWKTSVLPHWKKSTLPNDNNTGFNSDYFCHNGYCINYKELFEKLPKDD